MILVCLDTESGIVTRWDGRVCTHAGALTNDPEDYEKTRSEIMGFRYSPHPRTAVPPKRSFFDAIREQRLNR